ncbi:hypothetical protein PYW08_011593 [Mythimna loreyi]|uniref:Uncharacterized protein n=1 Tax=Mythimna loreyi TaxID=667449 RepID=A0ACC2QJV3_9NEOP|nr:hypothetical protein PYW08_011593 [Mythimna loreyi]
MTSQVLPFKNCCYCMPLRPGLLAWGYFKMTADVVIALPLGYGMIICSLVTMMFRNFEFFAYSVVLLIALITTIANFGATFVFVVGCHQRKIKPIRRFYIYSLWELRLMVVLTIVVVGLSITFWTTKNMRNLILVTYLICFHCLALHTYFLLLLKSEVMKLEASYDISVVNNSV